MSILVKPCQLSGRCPLSPLKKKAEFRGVFDCYLKFRWWRKKPKQVRSQLPTTTHRKGSCLFCLYSFLVSPPPHFQNQPSKTINPPPPPISASKTVKPPGFFSLPCFNHQFCCDSSKSTTICSPPHGGLGEDLNTWRRVMAPILRSGPLLRRGTSAEILRDLKRDARHIGGAICRVFYF